MLHLYLFFLKRIFKTLGILFGGGILLAWALKRWGTIDSYTPALMLMWGISFLAPKALLRSGVSENLSWILHLPMRKRDIQWLHYALGWTSYLLYFTVAAALTAILFPFSSLSIPTAQDSSLFPGSFALFWIYLFGVIAFLHSICFSIKLNVPRNSISQQSLIRQFNSLTPDKKLRTAILALVLMAGGFYLSDLKQMPQIILISGWLFFAYAITVVANSRALGLSCRTRKQWLLVGTFIALTQSVWISLIAYQNLRSDKAFLVVEGIEVLGNMAGRIEAGQLAKLLEQPGLSKFGQDTVLEYYNNTYLSGHRLRSGDPNVPVFSRLIEKQNRLALVLPILKFYDPTTLSISDLHQVIAKIQKFPHGDTILPAFYNPLLQIPISGDELAQLLTSENLLENQLGLVKAQFFPNPALVSLIQARLPTYRSPLLKLNALLALSIHVGRRLSYQDLPALESGSLKLTYLPVDCSQSQWRTPASSSDFTYWPKLNTCIRQQAIRAGGVKFSRLLHSDWIESPSQVNVIMQSPSAKDLTQ